MNKGLAIILLVIVGLVITGFTYKTSQLLGADFVIDFIKKNPNKSALTVFNNGETLVAYKDKRMQPLASTMKIIIAIEYAIQAKNNTIDANQLIDIKDLDIFYVPFTDGYAHYYWLESIKPKLVDNKISIREIAKGMITYSSNANIEWLQKKLGLEQINKRLKQLGAKQHEDLYYISSSLFIAKEAFPNLKDEALLEALKNCSDKDYLETITKIHSQLISNKDYKNNIGKNGLKAQRIWSDKLPKSTTNTYATLMQKLNSKNNFSSETHQYLDEVIEGLMQSKGNQQNLKHAGQKGGSTAVVLTKAFYATDKKGNTTELAIFFDDLTSKEHQKLSKNLNAFLIGTLYNEAFKNRLIQTFK